MAPRLGASQAGHLASPFDWTRAAGVGLLLLAFTSCWTGWLPGVEGHGRLLDPPSRSSMWRENFNNPPNYDDNQLFCGGFAMQWNKYGGKCGLCGDPWPGPRENEPGGKYANGIITRTYTVGQVIEVYVQLTANHKGYFEFRLCQHDQPMTNITQACLDQHLLVLVDDNNKDAALAVDDRDDHHPRTRYMVPAGEYSTTQDIKLKLRLPAGVTCKACVLQWKYNAGNSWGVDPVTKQGCVGCGPQEQFYGCADVAIVRRGSGAGGGGGLVDEIVTAGTVSEGSGGVINGGGAGGGAGGSGGLDNTKFPWPYFQAPDAEWHYGIAYVFGTAGGDRASISAAHPQTVRRGFGSGGGLLTMCVFVAVVVLGVF